MTETNREGESRVVALVGGSLIDGTGKDPVANSVIILDGPLIQRTGKKDQVKIPADAEMIDVNDLTVMPGMIDAHCHISITIWNIGKKLFTPRRSTYALRDPRAWGVAPQPPTPRPESKWLSWNMTVS